MRKAVRAIGSDTAMPRRAGAAPRPAGAEAETPGTKAAILKAALEVFARYGFDGASLPKIALAANVGHPLIHYHYGSKDSLWRTTVAASLGGLLTEAAAIEVACRDLPPIDRLKALIRTFALFAGRYPSHVAILMFEIRGQTERLAWLTETYIRPFTGQLEAIIAEARSLGQIKDIPFDNLNSMFMGAITVYFSLNVQPPAGSSVEDLALRHADFVVDVLLNGILTRPD